MIWLVFALGAALFTGLSDILAKKLLKTDDLYMVALGKNLFALPFLVPILFFITIPPLGPVFWKTLLILAPLDIIAIILYLKGIQSSPIALTVPFLSFSPVFLILTGFLILGEVPTLLGAGGILFVVSGAYVLNIRSWRKGLFAPFKAIFHEKGSVLFLGIALIYSVTAVLGKKLILHTSTMFFAGFYAPLIALMLVPIALKKSNNIKKIFKKPFWLIVLGALLAGTLIFHIIAISMVEAVYMISIKRTSIIISTVLAYLIYKEDHVAEHLVGAGLMFLGVVVILLLG
jgi:drug/metabolite transporter (DMT)-like permease